MNEFTILKVFLDEKVNSLKEEIAQNKKVELLKNTMKSVLEKCIKPEDLIYLDFSVLDKFDEDFRKSAKNAIIKARFLLEECKDLDLVNQPQYKQIIEKLEEIHNTFTLVSNDEIKDNKQLENKLKLLEELNSSFNEDGFKNAYFEIDIFVSYLEESGISEVGKNKILESLLKANLAFYSNLTSKPIEDKIEEKIEEKEVTIDLPDDISLDKISTIEEQSLELDLSKIIPSNKLNVYYDVKDIISENFDEARRLDVEYKSKKEIYGYIQTYKQCGPNDIPESFTRKVLLHEMYELLNEIEESIKLLEYETDEGVIEYIINNIDQLIPILEDYKNYVSYDYLEEKSNDFIFLNNVEKEFNSKSLKESFNRHQIISALKELKRGDFRNISPVNFVEEPIYAKKKGGPGGRGGVRVVYMNLANDLVLIMHVSTRQANYDNTFKNIYENNKLLIRQILKQSMDLKNKESLLEINKDFREEVYSKIEESNLKLGGKKHE